MDGSISGRVREASGNPGNITIELIRCDTYDAGDAECGTYDRDDFPTVTRETAKNGSWEFNDLLEGWYEVYVGEAGYLAANIDDKNQIDDDGATESAEMHTGLVKGRRDLAAGNNFYLYDNGLDDDDDLDSDGVVIEGTTDPDEDPEELTSSSDVITWASKDVTVTPDIHRDATFAATTESRGATKPWPQSKGVATVEPDYNETGSDDEGEVKETEITVSVTAENGYNDTDYTYMVYRAAPVGNMLIARDFSVEAPANGEIREDLGIVDQFTINVAEAATELDFTVTLEDSDKQVLLVEMGGDEVEASDRKRTDGAHESRYELTFAASRAITVDLTVTSEDEVDRLYQLVVRRGAGPGNRPVTGQPTIEGTPQVGQTLTANVSGINDLDGLGPFSYQWISVSANGETNVGTNQDSYGPVNGDIGNTIKVKVTFRDGAGYHEETTSAAVGPVSKGTNNVAQGAVTISGVEREGETLTATNNITDVDGMANATLVHQWIRVASDGAEANVGMDQATYDLGAADVGNTIKVSVSFTDDLGNPERVVSAATDAVAAAPTSNNPATGKPTISGTAQVGETLTADASGISDADGLGTFAYQWISNDGSADSDISGATEMTYDPVAGDVGNTLKVGVSFTDGAGHDEMVTSDPTAAVAAEGNNRATGQPTISGTAQVGETLTADASGISDADGLGTFAYQWISNDGSADSDISGATEMTYVPVAGDVGNTLKVGVSFTDGAGHDEMVTSDPTAAVAAEDNNPATGQPTISGTAQVGETLTAGPGDIADVDGFDASTTTLAYQWISNDGSADSDISGATEMTYVPVAGDVGNTLKVRVSFTDDAGNAEMVTSAATAAVTAVPAGLSIVGIADPTEIGEGNKQSFTVRLSTEPTNAVTVTIATVDADGNAVVTTDYATIDATSLRFTSTDWDAPRTVMIEAIEDDNATDHEFVLSVDPGSYADAETFTVEIKDDDVAGAGLTIASGEDSPGLTEGMDGVEFNVQLAVEPLENSTVTVTVKLPDDAKFTIDKDELTFDNDDWNEDQTVTVTASDDDDAVNEDAATITFETDGGGYGDADLDAAVVTVTVADDDEAGIQVSAEALEVREGASTTYTVRFDGDASG